MKKRQIAALLVLTVIMAFHTIAVSAASTTVTIRIEGMRSQKSAAALQKKLKATAGVEAVQVSFAKETARIKFDDQKTSVPTLREVINSTGFKALE